ncbi:MAG: CocE/NonD family hydrolase [Thermoplasmatota archaeon]
MALVATLLSAPLVGCLSAVSPGLSSHALDASAFPLPSAFSQKGNWSTLLEAPIYAIGQVKVLNVPSFDGTLINLGLYLPDVPNGTKVPVIMDAGPYFGNGEGPVDHIDDSRLSKFLIDNYVPQGYAVALVSIRGTGNSGGCNDFMGTSEQRDLDTVITWLGTQTWSNGNVAQIGKSYDGSTVWESAQFGNPHLKTIVPISGIPNLAQLHFTNGTAELRSDILWALYWTYGIDPNTQERDTQNKLATFCPYVVQALTSSTFSTATGDMNDPLGFWAQRNFEPKVTANFKGSIFAIHGLQDWNVHANVLLPYIDTLNVTTKLLLGQWDHAYPDRPQFNPHATRYDWAESLLHWFDRYLRNETGVSTGPAAEVEDNTGHWRVETVWPPKDAQFMSFNLSANGALTHGPGAAGQAPIASSADAADVAQGGLPLPAGVGAPAQDAWFTTPALTADLRFAGLPQIPLTIIPAGPGGHVRVELYDIAPNGSSLLVGHGYMDLRFAANSTHESPVVPGQPMLAPLQLMPLDVLIPAGHKLALRVTQDAPLDPLPSPISTPIVVQYGGSAKSEVRLPVIERTPAQMASGWPYGPKH